MPMEEANCPEYDAVVRGRNHQVADGVRHDTETDLVGAVGALAV